jgi:quinol monooxygenase YgiN
MGRRQFVSSAAAALGGCLAIAAPREKQMYGLIGNITAAAGRRDELAAILTGSVSNMPGCLSYIVAVDAKDQNLIWVTEVWDSKESHDESLSLPAVKKAIAAAKPIIAGFGNQIVTVPMGGHGLPAGQSRRKE